MKELHFTPLSLLAAQAVADFKDLNTPLTLTERTVATRAISVVTALLVRLGVIKTPSLTKKLVLKFRKEDSKSLELYNKTAVFTTLFLASTLVKVGDYDAYCNEETFLGVKLSTIQHSIDVAKVVLFEELINLGIDKLNIEEFIIGVGKDIEKAVEAE